MQVQVTHAIVHIHQRPRTVEHDILGDRILARDRGENGAALLGIEAEVVDHVAADLVEAGLVSPAPIHPVGAASHRHAVLADVPHLVR